METTGDPLVVVDRPRPDVVVVNLNQPERLNAISFPLVDQLHQALDAIQQDNSCRVVVLTGAGRGFCSGLDLGQIEGSSMSMGTSGPRASMLSQAHIAALPVKIHRLQQPVIAAVNGPAVGGGFSLALACDVRVASRTARFRSQFIRMASGGATSGSAPPAPPDRSISCRRAAPHFATSMPTRHSGSGWSPTSWTMRWKERWRWLRRSPRSARSA